MEVRFFHDRDTGRPHIEQHGVTPLEVLQVLRRPEFGGPGRDGTRVAEGHTADGRCLRVIYKREAGKVPLQVITAYDLTGNALRAYRRRQRRRPR